MTDKEALKLALEALELANINYWWGSSKIEAAITAIKEALAQPPEIDPNQWAFDNGLEST